jgi:hypothetical protein
MTHRVRIIAMTEKRPHVSGLLKIHLPGFYLPGIKLLCKDNL